MEEGGEGKGMGKIRKELKKRSRETEEGKEMNTKKN